MEFTDVLLVFGLPLGIGIFLVMRVALITKRANKAYEDTQRDYCAYLYRQYAETQLKLAECGVHIDKAIAGATLDFGVVIKTCEVFIDLTSKGLVLADYKAARIKFVEFSNVLSCEIVTDNFAKTVGHTSGNITSYNTGQQGYGQIVGSMSGYTNTSAVANILQIKIQLNDICDSIFVMNLIAGELNVNSEAYRLAYSFAQEIEGVVTNIVALNKQN